MKNIYLIIISLLILGFVACKSKKVETNTPQGTAKHVILMGSDGFGAYAFKKAKVPNLRMMMEAGTFYFKS